MERLIIACGVLGLIAWMWLCVSWMEDELEFRILRRRKKERRRDEFL